MLVDRLLLTFEMCDDIQIEFDYRPVTIGPVEIVDEVGIVEIVETVEIVEIAQLIPEPTIHTNR